MLSRSADREVVHVFDEEKQRLAKVAELLTEVSGHL